MKVCILQVNYGIKGCFRETILDTCIQEKITNALLKHPGCTVPWINLKSKICTKKSDVEIAYKFYIDNCSNGRKICDIPCNFTEVFFNPPNISPSNTTISAYLSFQDAIKITEEYYIYNEMTLFANIGGFLGLCLGISLVNIRDIFNICVAYLTNQ